MAAWAGDLADHDILSPNPHPNPNPNPNSHPNPHPSPPIHLPLYPCIYLLCQCANTFAPCAVCCRIQTKQSSSKKTTSSGKTTCTAYTHKLEWSPNDPADTNNFEPGGGQCCLRLQSSDLCQPNNCAQWEPCQNQPKSIASEQFIVSNPVPLGPFTLPNKIVTQPWSMLPVSSQVLIGLG